MILGGAKVEVNKLTVKARASFNNDRYTSWAFGRYVFNGSNLCCESSYNVCISICRFFVSSMSSMM